MNEFKLETPRDLDHARIVTPQRAGMFVVKYLETHPGLQLTPNHIEFFKALNVGRFWEVLTRIDGSVDELPIERVQRRTWAKDNFTHRETQEILDIAVAQAISVPYSTPFPGTLRGHSILYENIVEKNDSIFKSSVTPVFRKTLNNGRFWEELASLTGYGVPRSSAVVNDVLINHAEDLDLDFMVPQGIEIFKRNHNSRGFNSLRDLSDVAIDRYVKFITKLNFYREQKGLTKDTMVDFVIPYAKVLFDTEGDFHDPRYQINGEGGIAARVGEPLLQEYLTTSDAVKRIVAEKIDLHVRYGNRELALDILELMPEPRDVFNLILNGSYKNDGERKKFIQKCHESGRDISPYLI